MRFITEAEAGTNLLNALGLLDVNVAISSITHTGFVMKLKTDYGTFKSPLVVTGWIKSMFTLMNGVTPITITSVTEDPLNPGTYDVVVPDSSGDTTILTAANPGFEFPETVITFPA